MLTEEKFNALLPAQDALIQEKNLLDKGFNEGHWLFMIITEMAEAVNAHREGKIIPTKTEYIEEGKPFNFEYENWRRAYMVHIKGTFQDEMADIYIRLMSYCAVRKITIDCKTLVIPIRIQEAQTLPEQFMVLTGMLWKAYFHVGQDIEETYISQFFSSLEFVAVKHNIKIETFIEIKMEYNKSMQPLNGKAY